MHRMKKFAAVVALVTVWFAHPGYGEVSPKRALNSVLPATNLDNVS